MRHLVVDPGAHTQSPLHPLDARAKIVAVAAALLLVVSEPPTAFAPFAGYGVLVATLCVAGRVPAGRLLVRLALAAPVVLGAALFLAVAPAGGGTGGPAVALSMVLKAATAVALATFLVSVERLRGILTGLGGLGLPAGLVAVAVYMYRYAILLGDEVLRTNRARLSRTPGRLVVGRVHVFGHQAAVVFLRGWRRARRVHQAMASRGFSGTLPGPPAERPGWADIGFAAAVVAAFAAVRLGWP